MAAAAALANLARPVLNVPMAPFFIRIIAGLWVAWLISWHLAMLWRDKPTVKAPRGEYRWQFAIIVVGLWMMYGLFPKVQPVLWTVTPALGWSMVTLTAAGIAFAWWARIHLGKLWSGGVERMADHRVVDTGPYRLVRHPIYTGLIAGAVALAAIQAKPWAIAGAALFAIGFILKARVEERFLEKELGGYEAYRRRVSMIVPLPKFA
jgi:protein-S-isoprenylcysteine O-methyltransferase Ste14